MSTANNRKVCQVCGRSRRTHPRPFGKECKLTPLSPEERQRVLDQIEDDSEVIDTDTEDEPQAETVKDSETDDERRDRELQELAEKMKKLTELAEKTNKDVVEKEKEVARKNHDKRVREMKEEMERLTAVVEAGQRRLIELSSQLDNEQPSTPGGAPASTPKALATPGVGLPGVTPTPPGSQPQYGPPRPPPGLPPLGAAGQAPLLPGNILDPAYQVYAQALQNAAAQYGVKPSPAPVPAAAMAQDPGAGATAMQLIQDNPLLAMACGLQGQGVSKSEGKTTAEQYCIRERDRDKMNYYDFIHGALKLMLKKLRDEKKPILDYLIYYERLAGFALQFKFSAILRYHKFISDEVAEGNKTWQEPAINEDTIRFFTGEEIAVRPSRPRERESVSAEGATGGTGSAGKPFKDSFRQSNRGSGSRDGRKKEGLICRFFNYDFRGCPYGDYCQFDHYCDFCKSLGRLLEHRAIDCQPRANVFQGPNLHPANQGGPQAGNGKAGAGGGAGR